MKLVPTPVYCKYLFTTTPVFVKDSGHMLHFYFNSIYGLTSCSYSKNALINLFYKGQV